MKVLITGFEPFGGEDVNPSWAAARLVAAAPPAGLDVTAVRLSCVYGRAIEELRAAVSATDPALVVCTGQAGGRSGLSVERVAVNVDDARLPDNAGNQPVDEPIVPDGPVAYLSRLPVKACVAAAREAGVPAHVSGTAGNFLCNHVFYGLAHLIATERPSLRGGFVHVPYAPEQVTDRFEPSMSVADIARGIGAIVATAASTTDDLRVPEGATH
ncbi:pyroglutamyl-peptidase I [Streptomyces montanisoli]|uniref:Pyrrolidone-carboxylate peptidase n=1 Tax=Streptomyces montanisoli TaxID=2798581 RepID=A0A940MAQ0_9ACTN|nr:pyroglutamyl-peptidase I [Streptomyces montanisoli]MBP0456575.1 pyroglutamyl-peptidase I [Streptomyces montanisoli]